MGAIRSAMEGFNLVVVFVGPLVWLATGIATVAVGARRGFRSSPAFVGAPSLQTVGGLAAAAFWLSLGLNAVTVLVNNVIGYLNWGAWNGESVVLSLFVSTPGSVVYLLAADAATIALLTLFVWIIVRIVRERRTLEPVLGSELFAAYALTILGSLVPAATLWHALSGLGHFS